eukprot:7731650-Alexandrium_andersonii.AAC.1
MSTALERMRTARADGEHSTNRGTRRALGSTEGRWIGGSAPPPTAQLAMSLHRWVGPPLI